MFDFLQGPSDPTHTLIYTHIHILYTLLRCLYIYLDCIQEKEGTNEK